MTQAYVPKAEPGGVSGPHIDGHQVVQAPRVDDEGFQHVNRTSRIATCHVAHIIVRNSFNALANADELDDIAVGVNVMDENVVLVDDGGRDSSSFNR